ncbi:hypothetical protein DL769_009352 [Monosporascus sp. CRB-8-3]|nr:hypothetical protein DL769_009352 [Monosporascus sp. CRB-8-3]
MADSAGVGGAYGREWADNGSSPTPCALALTRRLLSRVAVDSVCAHTELEVSSSSARARDLARMAVLNTRCRGHPTLTHPHRPLGAPFRGTDDSGGGGTVRAPAVTSPSSSTA